MGRDINLAPPNPIIQGRNFTPDDAGKPVIVMPDSTSLTDSGLKVGDKLTPKRFIAADGEHRKKIVELVESLRRSRSTEAFKQQEIWNATFDTMQRLNALATKISAAGP